MSLASHYNDIAFSTEFPIDKIGYEGTASYSQVTGTTGSQSISNPLGYKCFITLAWSVDGGGTYYPALAYNAALAPYTVNAAVSDDSIFFYLDNFSGATVTFDIKYTLDTIN